MFKKILSQIWPLLVWTALALIIFAPAFGLYTTLLSPDSPPQPLYDWLNLLKEYATFSVTPAPHDLLRFVFPPYLYSDLTYILDTILIAIGFAYFLSGRGIPRLSASFAGGIFAFMGYSFTLFSAGHRGFFFLTVYITFLFGFLTRAIAGRGPFHGVLYFILLACCAAWGLRYQPDFAVVYFVLVLAYAIFLLIRELRNPTPLELEERPIVDDPDLIPPPPPTPLKRLTIGIGAAILTFGLLAAPSIHTTLTTLLQHRLNQIEQSSPSKETSSGAQEKSSSGEDKWIFATNWSLPPAETLELIAPAYLGRQSGDPTSPYIGELGRSFNWSVKNPTGGFLNFRQHIVYIGAIPFAFAIFAILSIFWRKKEATSEKDSVADPHTSEIIFWSVAALIALLLAYGRYTPIYRLFYSLPYMSLLRAPVKMIRIVEFSTAALVAFGLVKWLSKEWILTHKKALIVFAYVSGGFALISLLFCCFSSTICASYLKPLGAETLLPICAPNTASAFVHAIVGFLLVCVLAIYSHFILPKAIPSHLVVGILTLAIAIDVAVVARPFVQTQNVEFEYSNENPIVKLAIDKNAQLYVGSFLNKNPELNLMLRQNFGKHNIGFRPTTTVNHHEFLSHALVRADAYLRIFELYGCDYLLIYASDIPSFFIRGRTKVAIGLTPSNTVRLLANKFPPSKDDFVLLKLLQTKPAVSLYTDWTYCDDGELLATVARVMGDVSSTSVAIATNAMPYACGNLPQPKVGEKPGFAKIFSVENEKGALSTKISVDAPSPQFLVLRNPFIPNYKVFMDKKPVEYYRAAYDQVAIFVPAGTHQVQIRTY